MTTPKMKRKKFNEDMFSFGWAVQIGGTDQSFVKWAESVGITNSFTPSPTRLAYFFPDYIKAKRCGLWFSKFDIGLIVHEAFHATVHVMEQCHLTSDNNNEFGPCYAEWLTKQILNLK